MPTQVPNSGYSATPFEEPIALKPFLEGIADAIREKKKTTELINAQNFRSEILSIKGGLIEVTELPEVGEEDTVYKLLGSKPTIVPNNGYVEKVYFNTSLSVEEVVSILENARVNGGTNAIINYDGKDLTFVKVVIDSIPTWYIGNFSTLDVYFSSNTTGGYADFVGWKSDFNGVLEINSEVTQGDVDNSKIIDLVSITPFEAKEEYFVYENGEWVKISGGEPNLQEKEITENGDYVADEGYDGFSKVTVNVASSGEDMLQTMIDTAISCEYLFYRYKGDNVDFIKNLNVKNYNLSYMFNDCKKIKTIPLLDTSNVTNMSSMFNGCSMLKTIPQLDTSNVTNIGAMFRDCSALETIPQLDMIKVSNTGQMFYRCSMLKTIPQLDTSNVTNIGAMFRDCSALETIPQLDMIKVSNTSTMFNNCSKLTNLTLLNIKVNLDLSQSEKLTLESLINTVKELINVGSAKTLTMGTANLEKIASTYVKFTDTSQTTIPTNKKGDVVVCESTDEGAMLLSDYALLKNWTLA